MRVAWFSPMPPARTGIAACSAELVAALAADHQIDVYLDAPRGGAARAETPYGRSAHEFIWRHARQPYDLTVYQIGNASHHDYIWPYLFRYPGLTVLHDGRVHHARAAVLLRQGRRHHYRCEFAACVPYVSPDTAELAIAGFDSALHYEWPFVSLILAASRLTAVHSPILRRTLQDEHPAAALTEVRLGHGTRLSAAEAAVRGRAAREHLGIPADAMLFGVFGGLTPEKRIDQILGGLEALLPHVPSARLLLAGAEAGHYDVRTAIAARGLSGRVTLTGFLDCDEDLTDAIAACDVTLNLRWPTAREISGPWLRCLAAGKPSVVIDLVQTAHVPSLDPRTWTGGGADGAPPVTVAVDIMDEDHSLRLAMRRLASDPALRAALGAAARDYWTAHHSVDGMVLDYRHAMRLAAETPARQASRPPHLTDDGGRLLSGILDGFGVPVPWSKI